MSAYDYTTTSPSDISPLGLTGAGPGTINPLTLSNAAPGATNPPALSRVAPGSSNPLALMGNPPGTLDWPAGTLTTAGLPTMAATFTPAFNGLTGTGNTLASLNANTADAAAGKIIQGTVNGALKSYQVTAGADAQSLPGIVRPANYDAFSNAVVFSEIQ